MAKRSRKQQAARAKYLRTKVRDEKAITPEELAELEAWDKDVEERRTAAELAGETPAAGVPLEGEGSDEKTDVDEPPAPDPTKVETPPPMPKVPTPPRAMPPPAGALPAPPRVSAKADTDTHADEGGGNWQAKYRKAAGGSGREGVVTELADQWVAILKALVAQTELAGVKSHIDPDKLYPAIVLTLDNVLPDRVKMTPEMHAVGGTTVIIAQRFFNRKAIAEALKDAEAKAKHDEFRRNRARNGAAANEPPIDVPANTNEPEPSSPPPVVETANDERPIPGRDVSPHNVVAPINITKAPPPYNGNGVL